MLTALEANERIRLDHSSEPLGDGTRSAQQLCEMFEVTGDMSFMPCDQDRLDAGEVLVEGGATDACLLGNL